MIDNFFKLLGIPSSQLVTCANQTLYMVFVSLVLGSLIGIIFAFTLVLTAKGGLKENKFVFNTLSFVINTVRSIPFIILLVFILPVTKAIVGTRIGTTAALVPLTFFIAPYIARLFENSLLEVNKGIIEAAKSMGASTFEIILHFWIPEAKSSLILATTIATISLLGATAMAGVIGAGGLGHLAYMQGFQRARTDVILVATVIIVLIVFIIQWIGDFITAKVDKR